jgi:hypothetical protein
MASGPSMACPACSEPVSISDDRIVRYFEGKPASCGKCGAEVDWWAAACREIESGWVPGTSGADATPRDESSASMAEAFQAYSRQRYASMILPANTAVESSLSGLLSSRVPSLVSYRRSDNVAAAASNYSHQLHVLLPLIAHHNGLPLLPRPARGVLDKLNELRIDMAHGGAASSVLDARAAAELLCGALFGFRYVRYVEARLPAGSSGSF